MKRVFIACLILLVASVLLVAAIEHDPGYVLLSYGRYTLETSIWVGMLVFLLAFFAVYFLFSLVRRMLAGSSVMNRWWRGRGHRQSQQRTTQGLIAFIEGNWEQSRKVLSKAAAKSETPLVNYLIAARASHALDDAKQMRQYLKLAESSASGASIAVGLTQAELQLQSGHLEQSLATLMRVRRNAGKHPFVLFLLKRVYEELQDWSELLALLPELRKYKVLTVEELDALELKVCANSLQDTVKIKIDQRKEVDKLWQQFSKPVTRNSKVVAAYAQRLMELDDMDAAEKIIRDQLKNDWDTELVDLYGKLDTSDANKQLIYAENWLKERTNDAALMRCLGRLSLRNSLWGKARQYFESSLQLENSEQTCAELGRLLANLGEHEKSNEYFQRGLLLATHGLQALPMPKH